MQEVSNQTDKERGCKFCTPFFSWAFLKIEECWKLSSSVHSTLIWVQYITPSDLSALPISGKTWTARLQQDRKSRRARVAFQMLPFRIAKIAGIAVASSGVLAPNLGRLNRTKREQRENSGFAIFHKQVKNRETRIRVLIRLSVGFILLDKGISGQNEKRL